MQDFVHLHVHTQYSLLDGQASVSALVDKAMKDGMKGIAVTDHSNMFGIKEFTNYVNKKNSGKFMKAWLPKASTDNERSTVVIETPEGVEVMARQIAGAMARRIVTYAEPGEDCYIDEHMGFIKFGSRVDVYLPLGTEVFVKMGQTTTGNQTVIAKLK